MHLYPCAAAQSIHHGDVVEIVYNTSIFCFFSCADWKKYKKKTMFFNTAAAWNEEGDNIMDLGENKSTIFSGDVESGIFESGITSKAA